MTQGFSLNQGQTLEHKLSPQQMQSLKCLQMSSQELLQELREKLLTNPVLELNEGREIDIGNPMEESLSANRGNDDDDTGNAKERDDGIWDGNGENKDSWSSEDEERRKYVFDSITGETSLQDKLQEQIAEMLDAELFPELSRACQEVLGNLDDSGYLSATVQEIADSAGVELDVAQKAIKVVQACEPPGIAGRNLRECLLLQLERNREKGSLAWDIVDKYLQDLAENHIPAIAKNINADVEEVYEAIERIRRLNPRPGHTLNMKTATFILPDMTVSRNRKGKWEAVENKGAFPQLSISEEYSRIAKDKSISEADRKYLSDNINEGKSLIDMLELRKSTIEKIADCIVFYQKDFFDNGTRALKPLTMRKVAEELHVDDSTISRAVANKYMSTPHGIVPFRDFFTSGMEDEDGQAMSNKAIRSRIAEYIRQEDKTKPLSDQALSDMLKNAGLDVARRTVAKYREAEGIPGTSLRRIHK